MARPTTPLVGATPSRHPTAVVEWAARASVDNISINACNILTYWYNNASPDELGLYCDACINPHYQDFSIRAIEQKEVCRAQWVCSYLATMYVSPSQPHLHKGGSTGPVTPTPAIHPQVSSTLPSKERPSTPARSTTIVSPHSLRLLPLQHLSNGGEQAWWNIELPLSSSVGSAASGLTAGSTSKLY